MAFGVMGGYLQPQGHVQILVNIIDLGMNVQEAGDAARTVHRAASQPTGGSMEDGGQVFMEAGISEGVVENLRNPGASRHAWRTAVYRFCRRLSGCLA